MSGAIIQLLIFRSRVARPSFRRTLPRKRSGPLDDRKPAPPPDMVATSYPTVGFHFYYAHRRNFGSFPLHRNYRRFIYKLVTNTEIQMLSNLKYYKLYVVILSFAAIQMLFKTLSPYKTYNKLYF